jgi:hypothetical protein
MTQSPLHLMHSFGRKCDRCGVMLWPGMEGSKTNYVEDAASYQASPYRCSLAADPYADEFVAA